MKKQNNNNRNKYKKKTINQAKEIFSFFYSTQNKEEEIEE